MPTRVVYAVFIGVLGLLAGLARLVLAFAAGGPSEESMTEDPLGHRMLFGEPEAVGDGYTSYGREPVVAGRNGEPVGAYSGLPIDHY